MSDTTRANSLADRFVLLLATGCDFGFAPWMSGTMGAVWGVPLAWAVLQTGSLAIQIVCVGMMFLASVPLCDRATRLLGGKKDPGAIVLDEIVSMPVVFFGIAPQRLGLNDLATADWRWWLAGFLLHRVFDISKPPPARQAEWLPGGWGIMADDMVAALFACAALHGIAWAGWLN